MGSIGAIIQARFPSRRLPGKILKELPFGSGITVLEQVIRRLKRSKKINEILLATTIDRSDNKTVNIAEKEGLKYFRGSCEDVLSRYYLSAKKYRFDIIVRITCDCPCVDVDIVDSVIKKHIEKKADYTTNSLERTYPHGLDVEVFNFSVLEKVYKNAKIDYEKEHVTVYIYKNPSLFKITQIRAPKLLYAPDIRITLDTVEDYVLLCIVFNYLYPNNKNFSAYDIVSLFREKPWLKLINAKVVQKKIFDTLKEELREAASILDMQDLKRARDFIKNYLSQ